MSDETRLCLFLLQILVCGFVGGFAFRDGIQNRKERLEMEAEIKRIKELADAISHEPRKDVTT